MASSCPSLEELTLYLAQFRVSYLDCGLQLLGESLKKQNRTLRKLCLVNSMADDSTLAIISESFKGTIQSRMAMTVEKIQKWHAARDHCHS